MVQPGFMNPSVLKESRRSLRKRQTVSEALLWMRLRNNTWGVKFSRQVGIGTFIVDFCCRSKKLIIEVDGKIHEDPDVAGSDEEREEILAGLGYKILRFKNEEVLKDIVNVLKIIKENLTPLPALGEGINGVRV